MIITIEIKDQWYFKLLFNNKNTEKTMRVKHQNYKLLNWIIIKDIGWLIEKNNRNKENTIRFCILKIFNPDHQTRNYLNQ